MKKIEVTAEMIGGLIREGLADAIKAKESSEERKIMGVTGLAKYLSCSMPTAIKISKAGIFPRYQVPGTRQIFFIEREVLKALSK